MAISPSVVPDRPGLSEFDFAPRTDDKVARIDNFFWRQGRDPTRRAADGAAIDLNTLGADFDELSVRFEPDQGSLWCSFNHIERPCFSPNLLQQIQALQTRLKRTLTVQAATGSLSMRSLVWTSAVPGMWNLGGDLGLFVELIRRGAAAELRRYAYACVETVFQNLTKMNLPITTIALVQGDALGGGFEAVLTNDVIIAERDAKFGLPEILFNMFPGMGAYSLLCRRLDGSRAQQLILSGRLYEAEELLRMGLIDQVVDNGEGEAAVRDYLAGNQRRHGVLNALSQVARRCQPITYEELIDVTDIWVETALALDDADLRRMERLAAAQQRRRMRTAEAPSPQAPTRYGAISAVG